MKVKVLKTFIDKYTGKKHLKNQVIEVADKRFKEINSKGNFVEVVADSAAKTEEKK